ncbi:MAG: cyclic nucleotide-binding domain-containing protein [Spirochaetota bacterium]|nr:cyclic nucleotide-binding domain-containing protein [Spirochaetota bacterium]
MLKFIQGFSIFKNFSTEHKACLFRLLEEKNYNKGDLIIKEGDHEKSLFLLHTGVARIMKLTDDGEYAEIAYVSSGEYFGELSLIDDKPRFASVEAFDTCKAFQLTKLAYTELCRKYPEAEVCMLKGFLHDLVVKLRDTSETMINKRLFI